MIALQSVSKIFRQRAFFSRSSKKETHALRDISLEIPRGEVLGLLGPNGSGKSTTLKLISALLLPDSGRVLVNGADTSIDERTVRKNVGFALASERSFFPRLTARENLEFFAALEDVPRRDCRQRAEYALSEVGLQEAADKQAMKLSSGMYQRLGIARALLKYPAVLLLDEPSRSLDPAGAAQLWDLIRRLAETGITIVIATHNFEEAAEVCDRVAVLKKGELLRFVSAHNRTERQLRELYFELTGEHLPWSEGVPA